MGQKEAGTIWANPSPLRYKDLMEIFFYIYINENKHTFFFLVS